MDIVFQDTTSYPNLIYTVYSNGLRILTAQEGYVIHPHAGCELGDEELGIEPECYYARSVYFGNGYDIANINRDYQAVLESTVPEHNIFGGKDNDHEIV